MMKFLCVYTGNKTSFALIQSRYPSACIIPDDGIDCIALSLEDYEKYEQDTSKSK